MAPPIIAMEGSEIYILALAPNGSVSLEPQDIEGGRTEAYNSRGDLLELYLGTSSWHSNFLGFKRSHQGTVVFVRQRDPVVNRAEELRAALQQYLRHTTKLPADEILNLSLDGLVHEVTKAMPGGAPL